MDGSHCVPSQFLAGCLSMTHGAGHVRLANALEAHMCSLVSALAASDGPQTSCISRHGRTMFHTWRHPLAM